MARITDEGNMVIDALSWYINDVIENANELLKKNQGNKDQYMAGVFQGYYENLDMLISRLEVLNVELDKETKTKVESLKRSLLS